MENASKALLIAGSILISLIVIGAFILIMQEISDYQNINDDAEMEQQTLEFNNLYSTYNRSDIRGNDIISLMNRVVDYNTRYASSEVGFTKMGIKIDVSSVRENLKYDKDQDNKLITKNTYTEEDVDDIVGTPTSISGDISGGKIRDIEDKYGQTYANLLASEISNIEAIAKNKNLTTSGKNQEFDSEFTRFPKSASQYGGITTIYEDALTYYEYVQFKRTYFDCKATNYDEDTGRIVYMEFVCTGIGV